jgi:hypothetical protein
MKGATLKKIRILLMAGVVACFTLVGIDGAGAAGGGGESFCSNSGAPTGGAPATFGNPGEIISFVGQLRVGDIRGFELLGTPARGNLLSVADVCNPVFGTPLP